jgi:hypothetical protein
VVVIGVIAIVILKVIKPNKHKVHNPLANFTLPKVPGTRRLLLETLYTELQDSDWEMWHP